MVPAVTAAVRRSLLFHLFFLAVPRKMVERSNNVSVSSISGQNIGARVPEPPPIGFIAPNASPSQFGLPPPLYELPPPYNPSYEPSRPPIQQVCPATVTMWREPIDRERKRRRTVGLLVIAFSIVVGITMITVFFVQRNAAWRSFQESLHSSHDRWFREN
ncbi:uncharacterized protein [Venturia canescens]|uniref:uncharacterized protein n=1 Tax=Venturia canescens TaxID=32260 RepID=UPI001C9C2C0E|nr:uncharacterized protein LOC122417022 [Venturia canescens]